jgi:hypothetical protein
MRVSAGTPWRPGQGTSVRPGMVRGLLTVVFAAVAAALVLLLGPPAGASEGLSGAADEGAELVHLDTRPATASPTTGFATVTLTVVLRDEVGLRELMRPGSFDAPYAAAAVSPDAWPRVIGWQTLTRIDGTSRDGVWRGTTEVSPFWAGGTYTLRWLQVQRHDGEIVWLQVDPPAVVEVSGEPAWTLTAEPDPVRVVHGQERWVPRVRVTDRASGAGIAGAAVTPFDPFLRPLPARVTDRPPFSTDAAGVWVGSAQSVRSTADPFWLVAYGRRGTRGYSLDGRACLWPVVKMQANSRYASLQLDPGETLVVTGNVWPAPTIYPAAGRAQLQELIGQQWRILDTSSVRWNGRYTLGWTPTGTGTHVLRVRVPGSTSNCGGSVGTNLIGVRVRVG